MTEYCECKCFSVNDDKVLEADETFSVVLSSPDGKVDIQEDCDSATVTIIDDESRLIVYTCIV